MSTSRAAGPRPLDEGRHIEARGVGFDAAKLSILAGVDFQILRGERFGIIGPNGSGKSTLLRCLYAWHRPNAGTVLLEGEDLSRVDAALRARAIAVLAQQSEPGLGLTIRDVVALGRLPHRSSWAGERPVDASAIDDALASAGLRGWEGRAFGPLSGGEKQRVLFARALAQQPALLILDEPTNHLDIRHQLELLHVAAELGITVVTTLHDLNIAASWCDRVCLLQAGRVLAVGEPETVLTPALIGTAYGVDVDLGRDPRTGRLRLHFYLPCNHGPVL